MNRWTRLFLLCVILCGAPFRAPGQSAGAGAVIPQGFVTNAFEFSAYLPIGRTYNLYATTNFTVWTALATNIVGDTVTYVDTNAPEFPRYRFYQASFAWTLFIPNPYTNWQYFGSGRDGRMVPYPTAWTNTQGADGRFIAYPTNWSVAQGPDGRKTAFPTNWTTKAGPDGRLVAYPTNGFSVSNSPDGRAIVYPTPGLAGAGTNSYRSADWIATTVGSGRLVSYPASNFVAAVGADGRLVARVATGWGTASGPDGHITAYPPGEYTNFPPRYGPNGRIISASNTPWLFGSGVDGQVFQYPGATNKITGSEYSTADTRFELDFENQEFYAVLGRLRTMMTDADFYDYIIYTFFTTGEQRFAE